MRPHSRLVIALVTVPLVLAACSSPSAGGGNSTQGDSPAGSTQDSQSTGGQSSGSGDSSGPIVIGMPTAQTGDMSFVDAPLKNGAQLAVDEINAKGGVLGRKLALSVADTGSDLSQVAAAADKVLGAGAAFIIPTMDYNFSAPAVEEASKRNIISIGGAGDERFGVDGLGPLAYNLLPAGEVEGAVAAEFAYKEKKWTSAYMLKQTDIAHPVNVCAGFQYTWEKLGGKIVGTDEFNSTDQTFGPITSRVNAASSKADMVMLCSIPPAGTTLLKELRAAGVELPIMMDDAYDGPAWLSALSSPSNMFHTGTGLPTGDPDPVRAKIFSGFKTLTGDTAQISVAVLAGYSAVEAIAQAATQAGSIETSKVAEVFNSFKDADLAIGKTTWTASCHISPRSLVLVAVQNGKETITANITPEADLVKPHKC